MVSGIEIILEKEISFYLKHRLFNHEIFKKKYVFSVHDAFSKINHKDYIYVWLKGFHILVIQF